MNQHKTQVAIIGAGIMGEFYAGTLRQSNLRFRTDLVAVCDIDASRAAAVAGDEATAYTDVSQMLANETLDWVYLATPDFAHREPFEACMAAGVPCLVEKPLATTLEDARAMQAAAQRAGVQVEVNFSNHINPAYAAAKTAIEAGEIGQPLGVYARLSNVFTYPLNNLSWAQKSSVAWFLISHTADLAAWLTDWQATSVLARGSKGRLAALGLDTYDLIQCLVTYSGGRSAIFEASWTLPESMPSLVDMAYVIHGDAGQIAIDTTRQMVTVAGPGGYVYPGTLDWDQQCITDCLERLDQPTPAEPLAEGLANTALVVALHRSLQSGQVETIEAG
ncbi:MAG: Gfo/Idh/MocA family oxidoreductase [Micrococcales bacterium]|nr:Gfo/Idh/MocA family oxidoreductase [Micrococcales bacterium]